MRAQIITIGVIALVWSALLYFELRRPLRPAVESKARRTARNFTLSTLSLVAGVVMETVLVTPVAHWTDVRQVGLFGLLHAPPWLELVGTLVLFDYTLWWWHWASHRVPFLWRFHLVHHVDRDLDASTALRFHFGEHLISFFYRAAQIVTIGASLKAVWTFQLILFVSILFHHSNVRLPFRLESLLVRLLVTPRMHGIHHSDRRGESRTNYASLLTVWDYLHRTICLSLPQKDVTIGIPAYQSPSDVTVGRILAIPFAAQRDDWQNQLETRADIPSTTLAP
jgi:sterol desaturase/sphingolipid hydroxylase (fatty acid hydroxylase superfamily)